MKRSTIITVAAFALGIIVLAAGFVLLTDNNISNKLFTTTTTTAPTTPSQPSETYEPINYFDVDVFQYVKLGDYKDLTVKVKELEVTDEYIDSEIDNLLMNNKKIEQVKSGVIKEEVIFSFDFTGYLDGVAFNGGAGKDTLAYIKDETLYIVGGSTFIDGFAQGILNHNVGDKFSLDIKFPDNYGNADLAGKNTVFEITVNYIAKAAKLTDKIVEELTQSQYKTVAEFRAYVKKFYNDKIKSANEEAALMQAIHNAEYKIPEEERKYYYDSILGEIESYASMYQMTVDQFLQMGGASYVLQMEIDSLEELNEYIDNYLKENIFVIGVIEAEKLEVTDEEFDIFMDSLVAQTGSTKEDLIKNYTEDYIRQVILSNEAYAIIWDSAKYVIE